MATTHDIGIDPDTEKSGFAVIDRRTRKITQLTTLSFFDLLEAIDNVFEHKGLNMVVIEAAWLYNKSNWHPSLSVGIASKIGKSIGANHQVGKLIAEYCKRKGYFVRLVKPEKSKIKSEEFIQASGFNRRTNQEERDAAMLIVGTKPVESNG